MKQRFKKMILMLLLPAICILPLAGCGGGNSGSTTPMGRYVEDVIEMPFGETGVLAQLAGPGGSLDVFTMDSESVITLHRSEDGDTWTEEAMGWEIPEGRMPMNIVYDNDGNLFLTVLKFDAAFMNNEESEESDDAPVVINRAGDMSLHVYKVTAAGEIEEIDMKWATGQIPGATMISDMKFLENGDMVVGQFGVGVVQYSPDGTVRRIHGSSDFGAFTVDGDKIYICDHSSNSIHIYDGNTFEHESSLSFDALSFQTNIATGQNGAIYLYNSGGVYRLLAGGSIFEKIIEGDLTSLSLPTNYLQGFIETADGIYFIFSTEGLLRYTYNPNIAARPENELVVFTLYENSTLRFAAGVFQKARPDTRVNIQVGMGDDGATVSDVIRTLNTEILAGKGPDIILLDGLNAENYINRGVLLDITELIEAEMQKSPMVEQVIRAFERNERIYAVPAKFTVPLLFTDEAGVDLISDISSLADFAEANPEVGMFGEKSGDDLSKMLLPASMPGWYDGNEINEDKLREFLTAINRMAIPPSEDTETSVDRQGAMGFGGGGMVAIRRGGPALGADGSGPEDFMNYAFGNSHALAVRATGFGAVMTPHIAGENRGGFAVLPLPGLVDRVFMPTAVTGINAASGHISIAEDFLRTMLSYDIQSTDLRDGFPVNIAGIENTMMLDNNLFMSVMGTAGGRVLSGGVPGIEFQQMIMDFCLSVKTPYTAYDLLAEMVLDEAKGYFAGDKDIDKTIADIRERTRIYLAE